MSLNIVIQAEDHLEACFKCRLSFPPQNSDSWGLWRQEMCIFLTLYRWFWCKQVVSHTLRSPWSSCQGEAKSDGWRASKGVWIRGGPAQHSTPGCTSTFANMWHRKSLELYIMNLFIFKKVKFSLVVTRKEEWGGSSYVQSEWSSKAGYFLL